MSLRGHLLVAGPTLLDPNFRRSVVLVGEHSRDGAIGVVLDRPSDVTVDDAVPPLASLAGGTEIVHVGGPVERQTVVVLARFADPRRAPALVVGDVGFLPSELVDADALGELLDVRVFAGYAGWGPGQLEGELDEGSWIVLEARPDDVFTLTPDRLWREVLRRKGGAHAVLALLPDDPRAN